MTFDVINKSSKPISAYAIRQDVKAGANSISSVLLIDLNLVNSTLLPGQRATRADTFEPLSDNAHDVTLSIDYVEFTDGTAWGGDSFKSAEQVAGQRAGAREATHQLIEVLNTSGPGAVIEAISSGHMKVAPPAGHSAKWAEGFNRGISVASARLKNAFKKGGLSQVEHELRRSVTTLKKGQ